MAPITIDEFSNRSVHPTLRTRHGNIDEHIDIASGKFTSRSKLRERVLGDGNRAVLQCSDTLGTDFSGIVVRISWFSLSTETVFEMTPDGPIRDEVRLELVGIDILFLEAIACLGTHPLADVLVSQQPIRVQYFPSRSASSERSYVAAVRSILHEEGWSVSRDAPPD